MKRELPIVLAADKNFSVALGLAILSLLKSAAPTTKYDIYVLDDGVTDEVKADIEKLKQEYDFSISYFDVAEIVNMMPKSARFPKVAFARFYIPELLPEKVTGRILYTDADMLFKEDLTPLFDTEMHGKALAACPDVNIAVLPRRNDVHQLGKRYGVSFYGDNPPYFNSGVLLFERKKWQTSDYAQKIIQMAQQELPPEVRLFDQDLLNVVCRNEITSLPVRYGVIPCFEQNYTQGYSKKFKEAGAFFPTERELKDSFKNPAIIHYACAKPIVYDRPKYGNEDIFFNMWKNSPWSNRIPYFPMQVVEAKPINERLKIIDGKNAKNYGSIVSVIIYTNNCVRNSSAVGLVKSVLSTHHQNWPFVELLVIDNCSNDGTADFLERCKEIGLLRYIRKSCSQSEAYDIGATEASGKYILFLQSGISMPHTRYIESIMQVMRQNPREFSCGIGRQSVSLGVGRAACFKKQDLSPLLFNKECLTLNSTGETSIRNLQFHNVLQNSVPGMMREISNMKDDLGLIVSYKHIRNICYKYFLLSKITFGKARKHYKQQYQLHLKVLQKAEKAIERYHV